MDFGYDIADYEAIDPMYGMLADFGRLQAESDRRDIRVVVDMVLNYTSDQHPWFIESASSRDNPKAAMFSMMQFWLDRGVAGFRLDAIPMLFGRPTVAQ